MRTAKRTRQTHARRSVAIAAAAVILAATNSSVGQDTPPRGAASDATTAAEAPHPYMAAMTKMLDETGVIAARLESKGDEKSAFDLRKAAAELRRQADGAFALPTASPYAVHAVYVREGGPPPPGFATGPDRFTLRYTEVEVAGIAQPTVLVLSSAAKKMHWKVGQRGSGRLLAVLVECTDDATVSGIDESTIVIRLSARDDANRLAAWYDPDNDRNDRNNEYFYMRSRWSAYAGATVLTVSDDGDRAGERIVVGPASPAFRGEMLARQARALLRRAEATAVSPAAPEELAKLTFPGMHYFSYDDGRWTSCGPAEFTLRGAKADSLQHRSGKLTNYVFDAKEKLEFALSGGQMVVLGDGAESWETVPFSGDEPALGNITSLTIDTVRRRIVAAAGERALFEYDLVRAAWSRLEDTEYRLSNVTYAPQVDGFYVLADAPESDRQRPRDETAATKRRPALLKLSSSGKQLAVIRETIEASDWPGASRHQTQLAYVDGRLALFGGCREQPDGSASGPIALFDAETGKTLYSGMMSPWSDVPRVARAKAIASAPPPANHPIGRMVRQLWAVESAIERLRAASETARADKLAQRFDAIRGTMRGGDGLAVRGPAVHLVGCYQQKDLRVAVTDTSRPITLVLCAYDAATWTVDVAEDVQIEKVIVGGYHKQQVTGLPGDVPVELYVYDERSKLYFYTYGPQSDGHRQAMDAIRQLTGSTPATIQAQHQFTDETVEIGPQSQVWRTQQAAPHLAALAAPFVVAEARERQALLADVSSYAWYRTHGAAQDPRMPRRPGRGAAPADSGGRWMKFDVRGPLSGTQIEPPAGVARAVFDTERMEGYGWRGNELVQFDATSGRTTPIAFDASLPKISSATIILLDTRRRRLVFGGDATLEYDIANKSWSMLRKITLGATCIGYSHRDDAFYLLTGDRTRWILDKYSPFGVRMNHFALRMSQPEGIDPGSCQIVDFGAYLGIITPGNEDAQRGVATLPHLIVVRPENGEWVYSGPLVERPDEADLDDAALARNWALLANSDTDDAEAAAAKMASSGAAAVTFIASRIEPRKRPSDDEIVALIEQLGHDTLAQRAKAQRDLAAIGPAAEAALRTAAARHASAEVRLRAKALVENLDGAAAKDPGIRQQVRAMDVLGRIGSSEALEALSRFMLDDVAPAVAERAQHNLMCIGDGCRPLGDAFSTPPSTPN